MMITVGDIKRSVERTLTGSPLLSAICLALGLTLNVAIFSSVNAFFLRPLPVPRPQELMAAGRLSVDGAKSEFPYPAYRAMAELPGGRENIAAWSYLRVVVTGRESTEVIVESVSDNYFRVLDARVFPGQDWFGRATVTPIPVVISRRFWQQQTGGDEGVIGRHLLVGGLDAIVSGIAPERFVGLRPSNPADVWIPIESYPVLRNRSDALTSHSQWWTRLIIRPTQRQPLTVTSDRLGNAFMQYVEMYARRAVGEKLVLTSASRGAVPPSDAVKQRLGWLSLLAGTTLVFTIINVGALLSTHVLRRRKEFAIRSALGAPSRALWTLAGVDLLVILAGGAVLSGLLTLAVYPIAARFAFGEVSQLDVSPDWRVVAFAAILTVVSGLCLSVVSSIRLSSDGSTTLAVIRAPQFEAMPAPATRFALMLQVIAGTVLAAIASTCMGTVWVLSRESTGLDLDKLAIARVVLTTQGEDNRRSLVLGFIEELRGRPGIESVSLSSTGPLDSARTVSDRATLQNGAVACEFQQIEVVGVTDNYFRTVGIEVIAGVAGFGAADQDVDVGTAVVNRSFASRCGGPNGVLGGTLSRFDPMSRTVVGVVVDAKYHEIAEQPQPIIYVPFHPGRSTAFVAEVRAADPQQAVAELRSGTAGGSPHLHVTAAGTAGARLARSLAGVRTLTIAATAVTVIALVLVILGAHGIASRTLSARSQECAIRLSLGASRRGVLVHLSRHLMLLVVAGCAIGAFLAIPAHGVATASSVGLLPAPLSWRIAAGMAVFVGAVAGVAIPLMRVLTLDPARALRQL